MSPIYAININNNIIIIINIIIISNIDIININNNINVTKKKKWNHVLLYSKLFL